ncbi:hypothetical protein TRAPUB_2699 [Trametes pubescens]|uniref:Uncharacterized protein n=1 Tax=Trametes pubescens TaxID=154538 RepID=A0A1M2VFQ1_TRAPU|nr:hypothetical protein TRAPUB_2699 [Trametes pubescens]
MHLGSLDAAASSPVDKPSNSEAARPLRGQRGLLRLSPRRGVSERHHIEITRLRPKAASDFQDHPFRLFPIGQRWKAQWLHHGFAGVMSARRHTLLRAPKPGRAGETLNYRPASRTCRCSSTNGATYGVRRSLSPGQRRAELRGEVHCGQKGRRARTEARAHARWENSEDVE